MRSYWSIFYLNLYCKLYIFLFYLNFISCDLDNILTSNEIIRQVVYILYNDKNVACYHLQRRAILRTEQKYDYNIRKKNSNIIIYRSLNHIIPYLKYFNQMDNSYYEAKHHGESSIDFIINIVEQYYRESHKFLIPIEARRTNTGFYGPSRSIDEIKFGNWEI